MSEIETPHLLEKTYQRYLERFGHIVAGKITGSDFRWTTSAGVELQ